LRSCSSGHGAERSLADCSGAAWSAAALLIVHAVANLVDHGLMEAGVRNIPEALGSDAVRWHLLLWDPWWLLGGVLFAVAAWQYRRACVTRGGLGGPAPLPRKLRR
jgi:hypothetical protein